MFDGRLTLHRQMGSARGRSEEPTAGDEREEEEKKGKGTQWKGTRQV
jgi:hypothetical protein